ncbi:MAG TPA: histidinol-phosphate transaminase [Steroidobacteraceae bacterium]|nr:histidinol-phosphate transaminase [Steroidobacteraceae bacterium]
MNPELLALDRVISIPPYPPGRPIAAVAREFGLDPAKIVKLASNENPLGPSPRAQQAVIAAAGAMAPYPDFDTFALKESLSRSLGVSTERIMPGSGSSDHIVLVARAFLEPGRSALLPQYSFAAYQGAIASVGAGALVAPARNFGIDLERMLDAIDDSVSVIYLATPNNPTGTRIANGDLDDFLRRVPDRIVVVLDEAYREYLDPADRPATDHLPEMRPNVVVLRTFSKIHGLAGLRVGYAIGDPRMLRILRRLQLPFAVSALAETAAVAALDDTEFPARTRLLNMTERNRAQSALTAAGIQYVPSQANFILLRVGDGQAIFQELMRRGVIVRPLANYRLPEWIRVSVGRPHDNDVFFHHLTELISRDSSPQRPGAAV